MISEDLNKVIRDFLNKLIEDNYKKQHICYLTLGSQSSPQIEKFLSGTDLGIKPLRKFMDAFDYDLHLVPVPKDDPDDIIDNITKYTDDFIEVFKLLLLSNLTNTDVIKSKSKSKFDEITEGVAIKLINSFKEKL